MTTTFSAFRDEQIAIVRALTPTVISGVAFVPALEETDFRDWAQMHAGVCFRYFSITDLEEYEEQPVSNGDQEWIWTREEIAIAYPNDYRYGSTNLMAMGDVRRADWFQVDRALGIYGKGNYTSGGTTQRDVSREQLDGVTLTVISYRVHYWRAVGTETTTAMQNSSEISFRYTTQIESDEHVITFATESRPDMADATYVVIGTVMTAGYPSAQARAKEGTQTAQGFTLELSESVIAGTVIDFIVRDR